jgi:hypothetical protein
LVMEAPTSNIKDMLIGLYPQRWLPYRYLWPFSWNTWCNTTALERLADCRDQCEGSSIPPILILSAEHDEVIPRHVAGQLERRGHELGLDIARIDVPRAMHIEAPIKPEGREALVGFIFKNTS